MPTSLVSKMAIKLNTKPGAHTSVTHTGEIVTQGPINVVSKMASLRNDRLLDGLKMNELDITVQYEYWRQKLEEDDLLEIQHEIEPLLQLREPGQQIEESEKPTDGLPNLTDELDSEQGENCCHRCNRLNEDEEEKVNI